MFEIAYDQVDICVKDEIICNLFYDLHIVNQMAEFLFQKSSSAEGMQFAHC